MSAFWPLVSTALRLHFSNRRALLMSLLAPIVIAAFFGMLFSPGKSDNSARIPVAVSDLDGSELSAKVVAALSGEKLLDVRKLAEPLAGQQVREGKMQAAVVIPPGFGDKAALALFGAAEKPAIIVNYDPSQSTALGVVRGLLAQSVMQEVTRSAFSANSVAFPKLKASVEQSKDLSPELRSDLLDILTRSEHIQSRGGADAGPFGGQGGLSLPYTLNEQEALTKKGEPYSSYAHSFAGMGVQFILMMGIEVGVGLLLMRRMGLWRRLRAAPLSKATLLGSRVAFCAIAAFLSMLVIYAVAMLLFGVRVQGSWAGFLGVLAAFSLLTAAFGMMIAALGRSPEATRGLAIFATLMLVMLGGAWVPTFVFPAWLQKITAWVPTRWAVDGLDAMTWRGLPIGAAWWPIAGMTAVAIVCLALAIRLFDWDE